ncbi:hypothetical protein GYMLUDRAFT_160818, partial [Collybiopsis luxurians FD-317 M1]
MSAQNPYPFSVPFDFLQDAIRHSTYSWQGDLTKLFQNAIGCLPDIVWQADGGGKIQEIWGHNALIIARAPKSFQSRYF